MCETQVDCLPSCTRCRNGGSLSRNEQDYMFLGSFLHCRCVLARNVRVLVFSMSVCMGLYVAFPVACMGPSIVSYARALYRYMCVEVYPQLHRRGESGAHRCTIRHSKHSRECSKACSYDCGVVHEHEGKHAHTWLYVTSHSLVYRIPHRELHIYVCCVVLHAVFREPPSVLRERS
jgi:hypothetical protein